MRSEGSAEGPDTNWWVRKVALTERPEEKRGQQAPLIYRRMGRRVTVSRAVATGSGARRATA